MATSEDTSTSQSAAADKVIAQLEKMETSIVEELQSISKRVKCLEEQAPHPPKRRATESSSSLWADRGTSGLESLTDISWPVSDDEEEQGDQLETENLGQVPIQHSEENRQLVTFSFREVLSSDSRKRLRTAFPCPSLQDTRCSKLDSIFNGASIHKEMKTVDAELARVQALIHDPAGPLIHLLHSFNDGEMSNDEAKLAVSNAIRLLGNVSVGMLRLRRRKILKWVNPDISDLAEEDIFQTATTNIFSAGFEVKMKERAKSLKLLAASRTSQPQPKKFC
uniref:Uncharacterized protein n=1 Tax=Amphimedon queenslandica TaxID=400682 RepID=A0A1X7THR7_AMPQE